MESVKMTPVTKAALYFLRFYVLFLFGLIVVKFYKG